MKNIHKRISRRPAFPPFLAAGFFSAATLLLGANDQPSVRLDAPGRIRGAVYLPSAAYNAPQMWKNFSLAETNRDFGYAREIHLNALRIWASYEYWRMDPGRFKTSFDQLLAAADARGIRILISLFENDGVPPAPKNMWTTDPAKAFAIQSPGPDITSSDHRALWDQPRDFVKWFMKNYRNDPRLLAIEVMNEPSGQTSVPFAMSMLKTAKSMRGGIPLTMGCNDVEENGQFLSLGIDVIEFHDNFPTNIEGFEKGIKNAVAFGLKYGLPVWLTEWQRLRPSGPGWFKPHLPTDEIDPDYASLAPTVQKYPIGNFFWSLMVKRAYLPSMRPNGTINGLFWPDGSVWSFADARAIAGDPKSNFKQKQSVPPDF
ncbi:MAG TPA: hypothetical protein VGZ93_09415 [Candidatus Methylacidiphilales bacterium]|jgi:hypothetical protein|nr:hypothetical protein [Candidatus Methylacidiphilales bacterium]